MLLLILLLLLFLKQPKARCLDGSPGAFWIYRGSGSGKQKFAIHHEGGGWCLALEDCYPKSKSNHGSSNKWVDADCSTNKGGNDILHF